jgi:hypothetical protein
VGAVLFGFPAKKSDGTRDCLGRTEPLRAHKVGLSSSSSPPPPALLSRTTSTPSAEVPLLKLNSYSTLSQLPFLPTRRQYHQMSECLTVLIYVEEMKSPM